MKTQGEIEAGVCQGIARGCAHGDARGQPGRGSKRGRRLARRPGFQTSVRGLGRAEVTCQR